MDSTSTLATARTDVFGKDPVLGTDGLPLERGVGSHWYRTEHIAKAHYHAATAWADAEQLGALAKQITVLTERITAAAKAAIDAANAAKGEVPAVADPAEPYRKAAEAEPLIPDPAPPAPVNLSFDIPKA